MALVLILRSSSVSEFCSPKQCTNDVGQLMLKPAPIAISPLLDGYARVLVANAQGRRLHRCPALQATTVSRLMEAQFHADDPKRQAKAKVMHCANSANPLVFASNVLSTI